MAKIKKTSTSQNTSKTFRIPNKIHRQAHNIRIKSALATSKRKEKFDRKKAESKDPSLREARLATNLPDTIERKRLWDEPMQATLADDAETASLFPTLNRPPTGPPRILLTTSRFNHTHDQAEELANLFPNTTYVPRHNDLGIVEIAKVASNPTTIDPETGEVRKPYSHLIVANVESKVIDALTIIVLPAGPTFRFSVSSYVPAKRISGHGRPTSHIPELILNNFLTPLGKTTAGLFQSLFPQQPEFRGRQVVTLHNQRDFIFFRRHRYGLGVRVGLQEIGPKFTMKLRRVERGIKKDTVFEWKGRMDRIRTKFQL
ncbi:Brix-domain-containing protein [Wilcoxina mikolae CBS 423.85]|nr:Brix-domain-containing protein [Wilcoxina mikolae CBS 423.85]